MIQRIRPFHPLLVLILLAILPIGAGTGSDPVNGRGEVRGARGPRLVYARYLGGRDYDRGNAVAVDAAGNTYITGGTSSADFPVKDAASPTRNGLADLFVAKFDRAGRLVYATYLGGSDREEGNDIAVDAAGNAYVTGGTSSPDFPVKNARQAEFRGEGDAFVVKLDASGHMVYSTYLGGREEDEGLGIAIDSAGSAYITGLTLSPDFPVQSPVQPAHQGDYDAFVAKLDPTGSQLAYSTYLGGSGFDSPADVAVDPAGNSYVACLTESLDFPTQNAFQPTLKAATDSFVVKLDASGTQRVYATYLGGSGFDSPAGIGVDPSGKATVFGTTGSSDFPLQNAFQDSLRDIDAFVAKLDSTGTRLVYGTYLGGSGGEGAAALAVDAAGNAYLTGSTGSADFPTTPTAVQRRHADASLYQSQDAGRSWQPLTIGLAGVATATNALVIDPKRPSTLYAGTDVGVFRSTNGGHLWVPASAGLCRNSVRALAIDPLTPTTLYAGVSGSGVNGVYKSRDGGRRWFPSGAGLGSAFVFALAVDPRSPTTLYAGAYEGIFRSTDGGQSWAPRNGGMTLNYPFAFAIDPSTPGTLYVGTYDGVFKSTDAGEHWNPSLVDSIPLSVLAMAIDPSAPARLYASSTAGVFRSTNAGETWTEKSSGLSLFFGATELQLRNATALAIDPRNPEKLYAGTLAGIFKSSNGAESWSPSSAGTINSGVSALVVHPRRPALVYAGTGGGNDVFVAALDAAGRLRYGSFLGGSMGEEGRGIAIGPTGSITLTGKTDSFDFAGASRRSPGDPDGFVARIRIE